jgi:uncharacterized protein (DUF58 family)
LSSSVRGGGDEIVAVRPLREGDDPRDIYWRKSTLSSALVLRERAREVRANVKLTLNDISPQNPATEAWTTRFEQAIRDVASRAVAHLRRGDAVLLETSSGLRARARPDTGADPLLRFLALLEPNFSQEASAPVAAAAEEPGGRAA